MTIVWAPEAVADLDAAVEYLAERNMDAARRLSSAILSLVERLAVEPIEGPKQLLRTGEEARSWPLPPFRIYYQRTGDVFHVVRVYHQRREPIVR